MAIKLLHPNKLLPFSLAGDTTEPRTRFMLRMLSSARRDLWLEELSGPMSLTEKDPLRLLAADRWRALFAEVVAEVRHLDLDDGHGCRTVKGGTPDFDQVNQRLPAEVVVEVASAGLLANTLTAPEKKDCA